jgi:group II intron reverse transcriptase/maturase
MAIRAIKGAIRNRKQTVVIDADIEKFFDRVDHSILLKLVQKRISDPRVLKLINGWLKAGVLEEGKYIEPDEIGTPQGAVISPLLSNVYLHSFDKMWEQSGIPGTMVRYADDVVILLWRYGDWTRRKVDGMLSRLKLRLHPEKTRVIKADDGFDFLGVHFCRRPTREKGHPYPYFCGTWPSDRSMERVRARIRAKARGRTHRSLEAVIKELNPTLRGWDQYHTRVKGSAERRRKLNAYVHDRIRAFLRRKYGERARGWRRVPQDLHTRLGLYEFV